MHEANPFEPPSDSSSPDAIVQTNDVERTRLRFGGVLGVASLIIALAFLCWMLMLSSGGLVFVFVIGGLVAAPYMLIWVACRVLRSWFARFVIAGTLVGCCLLGVYAFGTVGDDAQGGLNLVFAPIYQLVGSFMLLTLAAVTDHFWYRQSVPSVGA